MRSVVLGVSPAVRLSGRAEAQMEVVRADLAECADEAATVVGRDHAGRMYWWTWAGGRANASLAAALPSVLDTP